MSHVNTVYQQLLDLLPRHDFEVLVRTHQGNHYVKKFDCWQQLLLLLYAQIKGHNSLRDITTSLQAQHSKHYHLGIRSVARSTLADANKKRDNAIFEGLFYKLLGRCQSLTPKHKFRFKNPLYSLDATVIDLCLSMFPWAKFRKTKGALKLHCLLDHRGTLPSFIVATDGKHHESRVAKETSWPLIPDSIVAIDRGYLDYKFLNSLNNRGIFFVTRTKRNMNYTVTGQHPTPQRKGLISDSTIRLNLPLSKEKYANELRLVCWYDEEKDKTYQFLTNNFTLAAATIAGIYKSRWEIETFFKWIKQNLKIKSFLGTSKNAVMTQVWVAMCYYLLLTYLKYQTRYQYSLRNLVRILRETLLERTSLIDLLSMPPGTTYSAARDPTNQLELF